MVKVAAVVIVAMLSGCSGLATYVADKSDAPVDVRAAALVADTAIAWRAWELLGWVK